ncbi:MAG: dipeptide transport system permease protein dppB [Thermomicrobiales bacterium]|jgi:peptide/nickel transport system permease protein|nr:dipeptide transport system permease protein dppB [Thermomicrobiales bacterium]
MARYIARRLLLMLVVIFGMSIITFSLSRLVPGNPARLLAGPHARQEQVDALAERYHLTGPVLEQYAVYLSGLVRGDLGLSVTTRRPVAEDLAQFLPATIELTATAFLITVLVGVPVGILSAAKRGGMFDHASRLVSIAGVSLPIFWLGLVLQVLFYKHLGILPIGGRLGTLDIAPTHVTGAYLIDSLLAGDVSLFWSSAIHLILPALTLAAGSVAVVTRMMRASVLETMGADYVRTARAKGLTEPSLLRRHVMRNAFLPTLTVLGLQVGYLLAGNFLVESVFNWPGIGLYAIDAIANLDYAAIMGVTLVVSVVYVAVNLVVDILYVLLDPRITYS